MTPDDLSLDDGDKLTPEKRAEIRKDFLNFLKDGNLGSENYCLSENIDDFNDDREVMLALVSLNGRYLSSVSERLKNDKELVLRALENDAFQSIHVEDIGGDLKKDPDVALAIVKANGSQLFFMPDWQDNEDIAREAVSRIPVVIKVVSPRLQQKLVGEQPELQRHIERYLEGQINS